MATFEQRAAADSLGNQLRWARQAMLDAVEAAERLGDRAMIVRTRAVRDGSLPKIDETLGALSKKRETDPYTGLSTGIDAT